MINPSTIDPLTLPSVPVTERKRLPEVPCIYFAIDSADTIQYIGKSVNPRRRWAQHHKRGSVEGCRIAYFDCDEILLDEIELALISYFDPPLNGLPFGRHLRGRERPDATANSAANTNGQMVIRETVTTDYPADGVGAAIKEAQNSRVPKESIEKTIRAIGVSRPYWLKIVNDDKDLALSKEFYLRICAYFDRDFGVKFDE